MFHRSWVTVISLNKKLNTTKHLHLGYVSKARLKLPLDECKTESDWCCRSWKDVTIINNTGYYLNSIPLVWFESVHTLYNRKISFYAFFWNLRTNVFINYLTFQVLPCLHTFCLGCLANYLPPESLTITCPLCGQQSILPRKGVSTFSFSFSFSFFFDFCSFCLYYFSLYHERTKQW